MTMFQVYATFAAYALFIIVLWAAASLIVQRMFAKKKNRPRSEPSKRQTKLYIHSLSEDWRKVK